MCSNVPLCVCFAQKGQWSAEKGFLEQQMSLLEQQAQEKASRLEESIAALHTERQSLQERVVGSLPTYRNRPVLTTVCIVVKRERHFLSFLYVD